MVVSDPSRPKPNSMYVNITTVQFHSLFSEITQKTTAETGSIIRNDEVPDELLQLNSYNQRRSANEIPAYVLYPDMERVDWINQILNQLWPNINSYSTYFVIKYIEPHIQRILKNLYLKKGFKLKVQKINLGSSPIQVLGVKCYRDNQSNQDQIILDCDLSYKGKNEYLFSTNLYLYNEIFPRKVVLRGGEKKR